MIVFVTQIPKFTVLYFENDTWAKSYQTCFQPTKSEHILWSVCTKIKESNQGQSFFLMLRQIVPY